MQLNETIIASILKNEDRDTARKVLRKLFSKPENIHLFAWYCFPKHFTRQTPQFHKELLELATTPGFKAIAAPRGFAKSTTVDLAYIAWCVANTYKHFILLVSDSYTQAVTHIETLADELMTSKTFRDLYGDLTTKRWGKGDIETSNKVRVLAKGQGMKLRGLKFREWRPDLVVIDDLENDEIVESFDRRRKLKKWFLNNIIPALAPDGDVVFIGTILHYDSLLKNAVSNEKEFSSWNTRLYKAINRDEQGNEVSLWPDLWTTENLKRMRSDPQYERYVGSLVFAQEYQNEPQTNEDAIIRLEWLQDNMVDGVPEYIVRRAFTVDPAISKEDTADFTAKVAGVMDENENIYITKIGNQRLSFTESVEDTKRWNQEIRPNIIGIESVVFQQAFIQVLGGLPVQKLVPDRDKTRRLISVSRHFEAGKVKIVRGISNAELLIDQLVQFPHGAHDDLVDAIVYLVNVLRGDGVAKHVMSEPARPSIMSRRL